MLSCITRETYGGWKAGNARIITLLTSSNSRHLKVAYKAGAFAVHRQGDSILSWRTTTWACLTKYAVLSSWEFKKTLLALAHSIRDDLICIVLTKLAVVQRSALQTVRGAWLANFYPLQFVKSQQTTARPIHSRQLDSIGLLRTRCAQSTIARTSLTPLITTGADNFSFNTVVSILAHTLIIYKLPKRIGRTW